MERSWPRLCLSLWFLTFEASHVILLRSFAIAAGSAHAKAELDRMVDEKVKALYALQSLLVTGALGRTASTVAVRSVAHYRKAVRANRRRLESKVLRARNMARSR